MLPVVPCRRAKRDRDTVTRILKLIELAAQAGLSLRTVQREISRGEGPVVTQLSQRRIGVAEADADAWLASRRRVPPGSKERQENGRERRECTSKAEAAQTPCRADRRSQSENPTRKSKS
jgi:predicted DNA-binding transcriptional regulator AlpA